MSPEEQFAHRLCDVLDQGTQRIDHEITERLRTSRERALQLQDTLNIAVAIPSGINGTLSRFDNDESEHPLRNWLLILALLLGVSLSYYWNAFDQAAENEEIDSALLSDNLPPNAYLDRGFQAWIEKSHAPSLSPASGE